MGPMTVSPQFCSKDIEQLDHNFMICLSFLKAVIALPQKAIKIFVDSDCCNNNQTYECSDTRGLAPQSGIEIDRDIASNTTVDQVNVTFKDEEDENITMTPANKLYTPSHTPNIELDKFLNRPVLIQTINWSVGGGVNTFAYPWKLFFEHPSIKKKIDNYAFIRCDLHLKIMVNSSPFYYGAALLSYRPMAADLFSAEINSASSFLVPMSQRPHVNIYPQTNTGGELILPFVYNREWLDLTSNNALTQMGTYEVDSFVNLASANGTTGTSVDIQIYAWAENVVLSGMTVKLAVQSGTEYAKGSISKPASAIARATGLLKNVPVIGPFMTATSIACDSVANIAALFGYTKVPVLDDCKPYKNLPFHGLATAEISDCTERLCIDSKNELTVNNDCIGDASEDPLLITNMVQRSSYLTKFNWLASDSAGSLLWNSYVSPYMFSSETGTDQTLINGTPMWLVSNLFEFWRGDVIFDFKIICSQYHKGRLRISWDPVGDIANTSDSSTEVFTSIIDISETTNVSMCVPYCQRVAYLKTPSNLGSTIYSTSPLSVDTSDTINGILTVRVLNDQTSPIASADISVLVTVRGSDNLEFAYPKEIEPDLYYYGVQSGLDQIQEVNFGGPSMVDDRLNLVYMGEKVVNLRSLLMRSNQTLVEPEVVPTSQVEYQASIMSRRPLYKGFDPNGIHSANEITGVSTAPYNFVNNTPYHMLSQCFLGERGSFTWKVDYDGADYISFMISRPKYLLDATKYPFAAVNLTALSGNKQVANFSDNDKTNSGALLLNQKTNTGVSFNAPMYSINSFLETNPTYRTEGKSNLSSQDAIRYTHIVHESYEAEVHYSFHRYFFQVGPDYSPVFFLNVPTMYKYSSVPTGQ